MSAVVPSLRSVIDCRVFAATLRTGDRVLRTGQMACFVILSLAAVAWPAGAQAQAPAPAPAAQAPSAADLEYATRVALAQGVLFLKQMAEKEPMGWIIPPIQKVSVTGYKEVLRKYRVIEVQRPVYEYTDVVVLMPNQSPGEPPIKQIRKQPTKQIGTRTEKYIRWDPEGPLEMIDKQPIYEHVGDTSWHYNLIGDSAMALDALRVAGVPESDPVVPRMLENLNTYLDTYSVPDHTWNIAWLTIAMARTEGEVAKKWTEKLASRLLDGQITDGPARGLWGPMCVHPRLFSVLVRDYLAVEAELAKRQAKAKEKPTKANQALVDEAEGDRNRLRKYTDSWSQSALKFATVEFPHVFNDPIAGKVQFLGSTDFFYNQRSADIESTWVALHALAVCAELKRLPKESIRPILPPSYRETSKKLGDAPKPPPAVISQLNATTVPPESAMAVLARAANALVALLPQNGEWNECNFHQPVTDFDAFGKFLQVPADVASFPALKSPVTVASAAQGIAALDCIARAVGMEKLEKFQAKYLAGARGCKTAQKTFIEATWPKPTLRPPALKPELCNLLLAAARPLQLNVPEPTSTPLESQITRMLILAGDPDGGWGSKFRRAYIPSSSRARYELMKDLPGQNWKAWRLNVPVELQKAHVSLWNVTASDINTSPGVAFATATAIHFLASRLENPGVILEQLCTNPELAGQRKGLDTLLLTPLPPKPPPVVAAKPPPKPAPPKKPEEKPVAKAEETVPAITIKPADTTKKKDESF